MSSGTVCVFCCIKFLVRFSQNRCLIAKKSTFRSFPPKKRALKVSPPSPQPVARAWVQFLKASEMSFTTVSSLGPTFRRKIYSNNLFVPQIFVYRPNRRNHGGCRALLRTCFFSRRARCLRRGEKMPRRAGTKRNSS